MLREKMGSGDTIIPVVRMGPTVQKFVLGRMCAAFLKYVKIKYCINKNPYIFRNVNVRSNKLF
jgi:hypothetical protein